MFASGKAASASAANYIEDVFSTYLTTGTGVGNTQTVNNGIDLAGKGGLVWGKSRNFAGSNHILVDTARGVNTTLSTDNTDAQITSFPTVSSFLSNGFTATNYVNSLSDTFAFWAFREQAKFFDIVTYTGTGSNTTIAHTLGSVPGCIIVKQTNTGRSWQVYHRSLSAGQYLELNTTSSAGTDLTEFRATPDATSFYLGTSASVNQSGGTYIAYLFAHDAGGFGLTGTDNVISCGSYTGNGLTAGPSINLGYEPQWIMIKRANNDTGDWKIFDIMRGIATGGTVNLLEPNTSDAEVANNDINVAATGFNVVNSNIRINASGSTYIYIAIRRGPMKVPTSGTSVLGLSARTGTGATATVTGGAGVTDLAIIKNRNVATAWVWTPRLTGTGYLSSNATTAETAAGATILQTNPWDVMDGVKVGTTSNLTNASANTFINYLIDRAPGFMDVVCYTGTGAVRSISHNLGVTPELIISKPRSNTGQWFVVAPSTRGLTKWLAIESSAAENTFTIYSSVTSTSLTIASGVGAGDPNTSGVTYVDYLFATCAGVSKVGSYTGTGTTLQVDCGFTGGARFVMIKRTDSTGDWYVWDTARGIVAGNDPYLLFNTTASEQNTDYIDTYSAGFEISSTAPAAINASGGTFIFLAIA